MPRYFFNVYDGKNTLDEVGTELPDLTAARQIALRFAGEVLDDQSHGASLDAGWYMDVTDEAGVIVFRLDFHLTSMSIVHNPDLDQGMLDRNRVKAP